MAKGRGDMFRLRRSAKMAPMVRLQQRNFAACRGVLTLRLEAHEVSGAIPAGSRAAPAGETCPPDLSSYRFLLLPVRFLASLSDWTVFELTCTT